ncbi:MAG: hypothetical protein LAT81_15005 [Oceanicaulis sp.]|nr:hypothetical protein [Oceanicaulis sp.]
MKLPADMSNLSEPQSLDYLLEDPDVRAGFEEAMDARESAEVIVYWRDHDKITGGPLSNAELARRLNVKPSRISALLRPAAKPSSTGYGPSYTLLKRICRATGHVWPQGLVEALCREAPVYRLISAEPLGPGGVEVEIMTPDRRILQGQVADS